MCIRDRARITFVFDSCAGLLRGLQALDAVPGWEVKQTKNKWKYPTPMVRRRMRGDDHGRARPKSHSLSACSLVHMCLLALGRATATSTRAWS